METFDLRLLTEMLGKIKDGERFGLSTDIFAALFPPGHTDAEAFARAREFGAKHRCDMDYWRTTNEVFFTKRVRPLPGRGKQAKSRTKR
jgi:hypothetical protein